MERKEFVLRLDRKLFIKNEEVYGLFVAFLLLSGKEDLELTTDGPTAATRIELTFNYYCSDQPLEEALKNETAANDKIFLFARKEVFEARDKSLDGVCSRATVIRDAAELEELASPIADPSCEFNSYDFDSCSVDPQSLKNSVSREFEKAVAVGISTADEYLACNFEKVLCRVYDENRAYCDNAASNRDLLNSIFGAVFLLLYPALFWSNQWSALSYLAIFVWSFFGLYYKVDTVMCADYLYKNVAFFLCVLSGVMLSIKALVLVGFCVTGVTKADIRAEFKGEALDSKKGDGDEMIAV